MRTLEDNLRFMIVEVAKQLENSLKVLEEPGSISIETIESRDDYIDNLKSVIENESFSRIHGQYLDKRTVDRIRALNIVSANLERIADHIVNIVLQTRYLTDPAFLHRYEYKPLFMEVLDALDRVFKALTKQDMSLAFKICRAEFSLDSMYKTQFDRILKDLRSGSETGNLVTSLFIFRYLERIGDALLNIGEAIIFAITGDKFKIHQYQALRETLGALPGADIASVEFQSIWGTRSGCRIGRVQKDEGKGGQSQSLIFKEGGRKKLVQERDNISRWNRVMPGLPPKVQAFQEDGNSVSMLIEYLGGCTLQDVVLTAEPEVLDNALFLVTSTVGHIWEHTRADKPVNADFVRQAVSRLPDVYRLHPEFKGERRSLAGLDILPVEKLLDEAKALGARLPAPFSVFIHGDFNINNIVYNHEEQRIHYIDLHRSTDSDYVQDVSVFLVSNFRLPVFQAREREKIDHVIGHFTRFVRQFAAEHGDGTFEARLALGLARSFITSTRFELNKTFAAKMHMRGIYLLEKLLTHVRDHSADSFTLPLDVLSL